ncbi:sulfatase-like hydrolase/transferase [Mariniphaga sediminis]|uniref:sulfatase-like hydrolase/transferase n=1 Tax=Mariniphaga sediminis TaxID=1628158 RepID=UPI0035694EE7
MSISCSTNIHSQDKPNIVWIVTEDISPDLSFYGDCTAQTPHLDSLAGEALIYENAYTTVGVCAPSRSSIITGMYPITLGTMHMRTGKDINSWGRRIYSKNKPEVRDLSGVSVPQYSAVIPDMVKCFSEYLRAKGYFCTNNQKTDYQFATPRSSWDQNGPEAHWRNRTDDKPFFSVFNINVTHESMLWKNAELPLTVEPDKVTVPAYLPDNEVTRKTIARHYSNIELMDKKIGEIIAQLKKDGLYDNTIIFFYSDHGGPLPREKREIYDTGLRVPFLVKDVNGMTTGHTDRLISFVDLAPTMLSLAGIKPPAHLQGKAFMGAFTREPRNHVFGSSDRFDSFTDRIRSVRDKRYLYIVNYLPHLSKYKPVKYRMQIPMMPSFVSLQQIGKLNPQQMKWFGTKTKEELYDCNNDPENLVNLVDDPQYRQVLNKLRSTYHEFSQSVPDLGQMNESRMLWFMWPNGKQPKTLDATVTLHGNMAKISCETKGASISYIIASDDAVPTLNDAWQLYTDPIHVPKGKTIYTLAERIGYACSNITKHKP